MNLVQRVPFFLKSILYFSVLSFCLVGCSSTQESVQVPSDPTTVKFIEGEVDIAPELADQAKATPGAALFIYVRPADYKPGDRQPPLAILRTSLIAFPYKFVISEANGMAGTATFDGPLIVLARLSKTGNPIGQPGDIEANPKQTPVQAGATGVRVVLDTVVAEKRQAPVIATPGAPNPYE